MRLLILFTLLYLTACSSPSPEDLAQRQRVIEDSTRIAEYHATHDSLNNYYNQLLMHFNADMGAMYHTHWNFPQEMNSNTLMGIVSGEEESFHLMSILVRQPGDAQHNRIELHIGNSVFEGEGNGTVQMLNGLQVEYTQLNYPDNAYLGRTIAAHRHDSIMVHPFFGDRAYEPYLLSDADKQAIVECVDLVSVRQALDSIDGIRH